MLRNFNSCRNFVLMIAGAILVSLNVSQVSFAQNGDFLIQDTIFLDEVPLDSIRFYLYDDLSQTENTMRDTAFIRIDDKVYRVPYRITATTVVNFRPQSLYFRLTGVPLDQNVEMEVYLEELFRNPREKLKDKISSKDWKNSEVYMRYFEPYDKNTTNRSERKTSTTTDSEDELGEFSSGEDGYVEQNYENFPLPETIDLEVDLRKNPRVLGVLGLEFDFDKLDKRFQRLLLEYGGTRREDNRKSSVEK